MVVSVTSLTPPLLAALAAWPEGAGASPAARRAALGWAQDPVLGRFATPGAAARAVHGPASGGGAVFAALAARRGDRWAAGAAVAALVPWLAPVACRWARRGVPATDVEVMVADLVTESFAAITRAVPGGPEAVVQAAWHRVAGARRTDLARRARHVPLAEPATGCCRVGSADRPGTVGAGIAAGIAGIDGFAGRAGIDGSLFYLAGAGGTAAEAVLAVLCDAVAAGRLGAADARLLAWQAAGWPSERVTSVVGCTPAALRARRSRALRRVAGSAR